MNIILAIVGHPATDHSVDETVAHGGLERIARRYDLVLRGRAKEVHELLVPPTVAEVDHAREVMRERGAEGGADIRIDLLAEVREAARRSSEVAKVLDRRMAFTSVAETTALARMWIVLVEDYRGSVNDDVGVVDTARFRVAKRPVLGDVGASAAWKSGR